MTESAEDRYVGPQSLGSIYQGCFRCGAKRNLLRIHKVCLSWNGDLISSYYPLCVDGTKCKARRDKRRKRSRERSRVLVLEEPLAPDAPEGICSWCGEEIVLVDPSDYRRARRNYHRGDEHEAGNRNCHKEYDASRCWNARTAIIRRGDPECANCGSTGAFEADHVVPLEDGGEHTLENLQRLCNGCHRKKTTRENAARKKAS